MAKNVHGLDSDYFEKALGLLVRDCNSYTPKALMLALRRLADTAAHQHREKITDPIDVLNLKCPMCEGQMTRNELRFMGQCESCAISDQESLNNADIISALIEHP